MGAPAIAVERVSASASTEAVDGGVRRFDTFLNDGLFSRARCAGIIALRHMTHDFSIAVRTQDAILHMLQKPKKEPFAQDSSAFS